MIENIEDVEQLGEKSQELNEESREYMQNTDYYKKINYKESNSIKPEIKNRDEITKEKKIQSLDISKENNINIKGSIQILHNYFLYFHFYFF